MVWWCMVCLLFACGLIVIVSGCVCVSAQRKYVCADCDLLCGVIGFAWFVCAVLWCVCLCVFLLLNVFVSCV